MSDSVVVRIRIPHPPAELVRLIRMGADGGHGEFDRFLPEECGEDDTWFPHLDTDGSVVWMCAGYPWTPLDDIERNVTHPLDVVERTKKFLVRGCTHRVVVAEVTRVPPSAKLSKLGKFGNGRAKMRKRAARRTNNSEGT